MDYFKVLSSLILVLEFQAVQTGVSPAVIRYKSDSIDWTRKGDLQLYGASIYLVAQVTNNSTTYIVKSRVDSKEPPVPIIDGDPALTVWRAEAPYRLTGTAKSDQLVQAVITWKREQAPEVATPGLLTVDGHITSTVNLLWWHVAEDDIENEYTVDECPVVFYLSEESPQTLTVRMSSTHDYMRTPLSLEYRDSIKNDVYRESRQFARWDIFAGEGGTGYVRSRDSNDWMQGLLHKSAAVSIENKGKSVTLKVDVTKEGLYSVLFGAGVSRAAYQRDDHVACHVSVLKPGRSSWYSELRPEVRVGGYTNSTRQRLGLSKQVLSAGGHLRCSGAGSPIPDVHMKYHGQCNPLESNCPEGKLIENEYVTTMRTMPDMVEKVYYFAHGSQQVENKLGWYTCEVENINGDESESFELVLYEEDDFDLQR